MSWWPSSWEQKPDKREFEVLIYEEDFKELCAYVLKKPNIETGGDLFGLWLDEHKAVIQLALGPGERCRRTSASFYQDVNYLAKVGKHLTEMEGLCHIGEWHSHHQLGLARPSGGDENTVWKNMPTYKLSRFVIFIANIEASHQSYKVNIGCFLFEIDSEGNHLPVLAGEFKLLQSENPFSQKKDVSLQRKHGAETRTERDDEVNINIKHLLLEEGGKSPYVSMKRANGRGKKNSSPLDETCAPPSKRANGYGNAAPGNRHNATGSRNQSQMRSAVNPEQKEDHDQPRDRKEKRSPVTQGEEKPKTEIQSVSTKGEGKQKDNEREEETEMEKKQLQKEENKQPLSSEEGKGEADNSDVTQGGIDQSGMSDGSNSVESEGSSQDAQQIRKDTQDAAGVSVIEHQKEMDDSTSDSGAGVKEKEEGRGGGQDGTGEDKSERKVGEEEGMKDKDKRAQEGQKETEDRTEQNSESGGPSPVAQRTQNDPENAEASDDGPAKDMDASTGHSTVQDKEKDEERREESEKADAKENEKKLAEEVQGEREKTEDHDHQTDGSARNQGEDTKCGSKKAKQSEVTEGSTARKKGQDQRCQSKGSTNKEEKLKPKGQNGSKTVNPTAGKAKANPRPEKRGTGALASGGRGSAPTKESTSSKGKNKAGATTAQSQTTGKKTTPSSSGQNKKK